MSSADIKIHQPSIVTHQLHGTCGVTLQESQQDIEIFSMFSGKMHTGFVVLIAGSQWRLQVSNEMHSELIHRRLLVGWIATRGKSTFGQTVKGSVMFEGSE